MTRITVHGARRIVLSALIASIALGTFRLSFDAQRALAIGAGIEPSLAWLYPVIVDASIVLAYLVVLWADEPTRWQRAYPWLALGLFSAVSVAGNAAHITVLPSSAIIIDPLGAIAVHTVPAVALLVATHLAAMSVLRPRRTPAAVVEPKRTRRAPAQAQPAEAPPAVERTYTDAELPALHEAPDGTKLLSLRAIADETGIAKSTVGERIKAERLRSGAPSPAPLRAV